MGGFPTIIYLAGSGRSGSTLVERMLGEIPGFVNVGELIDLFRRVHEGDELCGCGDRFSQCEFWTAVGQRAFGGWKPELMAHVARLQRAVARQRFIPHHISPRKTAHFRRDVEQYRDVYSRLYRAVAETAGAEVVVDASKWPAQAMALASNEIDLRVIHVVRDVRGVAWSMNKRDVLRPHVTNGVDVMFNRGLFVAAADWALCQLEVDALRLLRVPMAQISYENLASEARAEVGRALDTLALDVAQADLAHLRDGEADLGPSHGLSGNPSRFNGGVTRLRTDLAWREEMSRPKQVLIAGLGLPHRLRGGFVKDEVTRVKGAKDS